MLLPQSEPDQSSRKNTDSFTLSKENRVTELLDQLRPLLPIQNPMPFFVHNNPLMYWEKFPFAEGIEHAVLTYENTPANKTRHMWREMEDFTLPIIISYFDQGMNLWTSSSDRKGLWDWYLKYIDSSLSLKSKALSPLKKSLVTMKSKGPETLLEELLTRRFGHDEAHWENYLKTLLFHFKGWSGMVNVLEKNEHLFPLSNYHLSLLEWVLLLATAEDAFYQHAREGKEPLLWDLEQVKPKKFLIKKKLEDIQTREKKYYAQIITELKDHILKVRENKLAAPKTAPLAQAFFCLDDREESFRRALETVNPQYETYGTVGFYGIDMALKRPNHMIYQAQCPPVVTPRKKAREIATSPKSGFILFLRKFIPYLNRGHFTLLEPLIALFLWPVYLVALTLRTFFPSTYQTWRNSFHLDRYLDEESHVVFDEPYTLLEKATIVKDILGGAGLVEVKSKLIFIVGHAATMINNPFQQSYGCGACSGQAGFSNAKVFCEFANDSEVREEVRKMGITIDDDVEFLAACHDTALDKIFYDRGHAREDQKFTKHPEIFSNFQKDAEKALALNKKERWQQFKLKEKEEALTRSCDWSQPRPEFGHSKVAVSVFGPRWLTEGYDLKRQAFLVSYDPDCDPTGEHLTYNILGALPVCANINLDYFTSNVFPEAFSAGSKLPLNIVSGIGLMGGAKGDLKIGLATQMTDQHEALRLLVFLYCDLDKLENVLQKSPRLQRIFKNNWMHVVRIDPATFTFHSLTTELQTLNLL